MEQKVQEKLHILLEVCQLLSAKTELGDVLQTIIELSSKVVNSERGSLFLLDEKTQELYFHVAMGLDSEVAKIRLKIGQGIVGTVALEKRPLIINDCRSDPRWTAKVDLKSGFVTRSILAVPLVIKGQMIGVVEAINHVDGPFTPDDLEIFEAFATQAAIAIDNARLFASLREQTVKLDTIFTQMNDAVVLTDAEGGVLLSNRAARRFFLAEGGAPRTLAHELSEFAVTPPFAEVLGSSALEVSFEAVRELPKKCILAGTGTYLRFEGVGTVPGWQGRLFVFRDVTEERQEEMLKRSFMSLISHKLKTPLASITGYAQILLDDLPQDGTNDPVRKPVKTIMTQGRKLTELVDKLLRFVNLQELDTSSFLRKPFAIDGEIVEAVKSLAGWLKESNASVTFDTRAGKNVFGNPLLIREAVKNLVDNAVKFDPRPEKTVTIWTDEGEGSVAVHVRDQGPGIPPEEHERVFSKFYQVESSFTGQVEGWGLGLPFVKRVVEQHGGKVTLESRIGAGTTVTFTLPPAPS